MRRYGGSIIHCEPTLMDCERTTGRVIAASSATLIHPTTTCG